VFYAVFESPNFQRKFGHPRPGQRRSDSARAGFGLFGGVTGVSRVHENTSAGSWAAPGFGVQMWPALRPHLQQETVGVERGRRGPCMSLRKSGRLSSRLCLTDPIGHEQEQHEWIVRILALNPVRSSTVWIVRTGLLCRLETLGARAQCWPKPTCKDRAVRRRCGAWRPQALRAKPAAKSARQIGKALPNRICTVGHYLYVITGILFFVLLLLLIFVLLNQSYRLHPDSWQKWADGCDRAERRERGMRPTNAS
jgi:hypothetical protein